MDTVCKIIRCSFHIIFEHSYTTLNLDAIVKSPKIRLLRLAPKRRKIDPPSHTIFCSFGPPLSPPFGCALEFGTPCIDANCVVVLRAWNLCYDLGAYNFLTQVCMLSKNRSTTDNFKMLLSKNTWLCPKRWGLILGCSHNITWWFSKSHLILPWK